MRRYQLCISGPCNEGLEHRPVIRRPESVKTSLRQVWDTWGKLKAKQIGQGEDMVADAAAMGMVGRYAQVGLVVEQPVDDIGGLPGGRNHDRVVWRLACREVRVKKCGSGPLVMRVDSSNSFPRAGGRKVLPVRTRHIGGAE